MKASRLPAAVLAAMLLPGCAALVAKKHTYGSREGAVVNGSKVSLQVKPEGSSGGNFMLSAMVVSAGVATLDGPFRWRVEATGEAGKHESLVIHRLRTRTATTRRDEWYPRKHLGKRADFRPVKSAPGEVRAVYEIPGTLEVKPREDGALDILADLSVKADGRWERKVLKFHLDPAEKRQDEMIFLPAEIVRSIGSDPQDWEDPAWD
jgi:hypothetical protein